MNGPGAPDPTETEEPETESSDSPQTDRERLDRSLVQGVAWTSGTKWAVQVITWAATILVMRLLTPEDYGLVGMAGLFLGLVTLVSEFGLGSAVVAIRELTERQIRQLHSVAMIVGLGALALSVAAARPVAAFFESPRLTTVILVLSTTFVLSALTTVPAAILRRELRYRTLALVEAGEAIVQVALTLGLAWLGFGYWALVLGRVSKFVVSASVYWMIVPQGYAVPRAKEIWEALTFSSDVILARIGWYTYSNADYLILGKLLGQNALGLYTSAFTLSRMPVEKIAGMVSRVTPGIFSAVQDDHPSLRRYILILSEGLSLVTFPPIIGIGLVASELIPFMLGDDWVGAIVPLQILSVGAAYKAVTPLLPQVLAVIKETRFARNRSLIAAVVFLPAFYFGGLYWGVAGVATVWVVLDPILVAIPILLRIRKRIDLSVRVYLAALWPAASGSLVMAAGVFATRAHLGDDLSTPALLAAEVGVGAALYGLVVLVLHRPRLKRLIGAARLLRN